MASAASFAWLADLRTDPISMAIHAIMITTGNAITTQIALMARAFRGSEERRFIGKPTNLRFGERKIEAISC